MRKFLIRWWYTPSWEQDRHTRMIERWNDSRPATPEVGLSVRFIQSATPEDVRYEVIAAAWALQGVSD